MVVHVDGQKAAFSLEDGGFEMTWNGGVLTIKDKKLESLPFGYTNSAIPSNPATGNWYLVVYDKDSYYSNHYCSSRYHWDSSKKEQTILNLLIRRINGNHEASATYYFGLSDTPISLYISNKIVGNLEERP